MISFFFLRKGRYIKLEHSTSPFYKQDPVETRNYRKVPRDPVHRPHRHRSNLLGNRNGDDVLHELRSTRIKARSSKYSAGRPQIMVEPQEPPPQTSRQGGSMTLNEHWRSERQRKRRRSLQRTPRPAEDEAEASTT